MRLRLRVLGVAIVMFAMAGIVACVGGWWLMYRYSRSAADGGVDGPFLVGAIISGCFAVCGLALFLARVRVSTNIADPAG